VWIIEDDDGLQGKMWKNVQINGKRINSRKWMKEFKIKSKCNFNKSEKGAKS